MPISVAVVPTQPSTAAYSTSALQLTQQFSRASYEGKGWGQPAPFDPTKAIKSWFLTDAVGNPLPGTQTFDVIQPGAVVVSQITMDGLTCASVNIPGAYRFPKWVNPPTTVATNAGVPINAANLCLLADAIILQGSVNPNVEAPDNNDPEFATVVWGSENRRAYRVTMTDGSVLNAATLLAIWSNSGIGSPGTWNPAVAGTAMFTPTPAPDLTGIPVTPVPIRPLLTGEVLRVISAGEGISVVNTNMDAQPSTGGSTTVTGGGMTDAQAAQLETVFNWVVKQGG